eukprot:3061700-Prymnesium_polylepis.1
MLTEKIDELIGVMKDGVRRRAIDGGYGGLEAAHERILQHYAAEPVITMPMLEKLFDVHPRVSSFARVTIIHPDPHAFCFVAGPPCPHTGNHLELAGGDRQEP